MLLLDEPLGALDLKLREEMQIELKRIQQQVGITFIYVTHDQEEALTMSDRLAVFNHGRIEQIGAPGRGLRAARDAVRGRLRRDVEPAHAAMPPGRSSARPARSPSGPRRSAWPRPTAQPAAGRDRGRGRIAKVVYLGPDTRYIVALEAGGELVVTQQNLRDDLDRGARPGGPDWSGSSGSGSTACPSQRRAAGMWRRRNERMKQSEDLWRVAGVVALVVARL